VTTRERQRLPLQPGAFLWGPLRARHGISLRQLAELSGESRGELSKAERGLIVVSAPMFEAVYRALAERVPASGVDRSG
jgi:transcriptional regulator with XRE-family HTH domain